MASDNPILVHQFSGGIAAARNTSGSGRGGKSVLAALLCASVCVFTPTNAGVAPNPGGPIVITNSTTATISYADTPVTQRVDEYSTTLLSFLNGSQISSQTFLFAFSDPTVQSAVTQADTILTGDGASFGAPILNSSVVALLSSVTIPPPTYSCPDFYNGPTNYPPGTSVTGNVVTTATTFGPATINVGECLGDTFTVLAGQEDINVNTENDFLVTQSVLTTDTYLTTATYEINGVTSNNSVPEPGTLAMLLAGAGMLLFIRRRRFKSALGKAGREIIAG
jgi:hypothetical protein